MSFADVFKNSFLENFSVSPTDIFTIITNIFISALFGIFIFLVYRKITKKTFYVNSFNVSLVAMAVITAAIIITIQSNVVLSLGMVGALSIVRFRTAIKDPLDLVFLYWSISVGIICGAGLAQISAVLSLIMTAIVFLLQKYPAKKKSMILIINGNKTDIDNTIIDVVKKHSKYYKVKSKNLTVNSLDMIVEINISDESSIVHEIMEIDGVTSASVLSHDGEITA